MIKALILKRKKSQSVESLLTFGARTRDNSRSFFTIVTRSIDNARAPGAAQVGISSCVCGILLCLALGSVGMAQEPAPETGGFTFKRVGVPKPGTQNRITVQIGPRAPAPAPPAEEAELDPEPSEEIGRFSWYWDALRSGSVDGANVLDRALLALDRAPQGQAAPTTPQLSFMQGIVEAHGTDMLLKTVGTRVSPALVLAVTAVESSGDPTAVSPAGAAGLMQLMPATAERFGVQDRLDPTESIEGGVAFLDLLMEMFAQDPLLVLAGYNAGENAVASHGGVPPFAETRDYVPKVLAAWKVARGLCRTPPELFSDPCVFAVGRS